MAVPRISGKETVSQIGPKLLKSLKMNGSLLNQLYAAEAQQATLKGSEVGRWLLQHSQETVAPTETYGSTLDSAFSSDSPSVLRPSTVAEVSPVPPPIRSLSRAYNFRTRKEQNPNPSSKVQKQRRKAILPVGSATQSTVSLSPEKVFHLLQTVGSGSLREEVIPGIAKSLSIPPSSPFVRELWGLMDASQQLGDQGIECSSPSLDSPLQDAPGVQGPMSPTIEQTAPTVLGAGSEFPFAPIAHRVHCDIFLAMPTDEKILQYVRTQPSLARLILADPLVKRHLS